MAENLKVPSIYSPKTVNELLADMAKNPTAVLFAGGTWLMSRPGFYPDTHGTDFITLNSIPELGRVMHADRYTEAGATVTLQQLLNTGANFFSPEVYKAIENIGTTVIRNQATVGGSLCSPDMRFAMSCILSTLQAQAELRTITRRGKARSRIFNSSRWVQVSKLYAEDGTFLYKKDAVLAKVRIPASDGSRFVFRTLGSPVREQESALFFALRYSINQTSMASPALCVAVPRGGFYSSSEFDNSLTALTLPLSTVQITKSGRRLVEELREKCPGISELQTERAKRLLETVLFGINSEYLAG